MRSALLGLLLAVFATHSSADQAAGTEQAPGAAKTGDTATRWDSDRAGASGTPVGLDALLRLPTGFDSGRGDRRGGADEAEWRQRFLAMETELEEVRNSLERARAEYDATASESEQWQVAPPGATNPQTSPLSFRLREEMRRLREELDRAEKRRRDLEIEANLAGVPETWRR